MILKVLCHFADPQLKENGHNDQNSLYRKAGWKTQVISDHTISAQTRSTVTTLCDFYQEDDM